MSSLLIESCLQRTANQKFLAKKSDFTVKNPSVSSKLPQVIMLCNNLKNANLIPFGWQGRFV